MSDDLCVNCSMCCNGSLYARVAVTEEEIERLNGRGNFFNKPDGALRMRLCCSHLGGDGACHVYEDRPKVCRTYRCKLLRKVDAGEITSAEAIEIVREIREVEALTRDRIATALGSEAQRSSRTSIHDDIDHLDSMAPESEPFYHYDHAIIFYDHFVKLLQLHLKSDFKR